MSRPHSQLLRVLYTIHLLQMSSTLQQSKSLHHPKFISHLITITLFARKDIEQHKQVIHSKEAQLTIWSISGG